MLRFTAVLFLGISFMYGQRGGGDWTTAGNDAQRSGWVRSDPKISPAALDKPGFAFLWKVPLKNDLSAPVLLERYIGYRGFRSLAFLSGGAGDVFALDTDLGRVEWQKHLAATPACGSAMTASVARPTMLEFPAAGSGGGFGGRGSAARSGVGEPGQGAVTLLQVGLPRGGPAFTPPRARPGARRSGGAYNPFQRGPAFVYALSADGKLHAMYVSNGEEPQAAMQFLPPGAEARGLIVVDDVAYAATTSACGGTPALWALDLETKQAVSWKPEGGIAGAEGPAFGPDGTLYVAAGNGDLIALEPKTLKLKGSYRAGAEFTTSPLLFEENDKVLAAAATKDGMLHLVDVATLTGAAVKLAAANGLASWQESGGTRWLIASGPGAVSAWKLTLQNGAPALEAGWTTPLDAPLSPMVVNGVVFAASAGGRAKRTVLHALDGRTGKELWGSGNSIQSAVRSGGLSAGGSQVYLGTEDGVLYAFGFPIEH